MGVEPSRESCQDPSVHELQPVPLRTIAAQWGRIGVTGFGGPPAHIVLLRRLCVEQRAWLSEHEFEDGIAATNLLPGPASTQLAIYCALRLRGWRGALVGGLCFIAPGLALILCLAAVFLAAHPPRWVLGAAAGAGAAVPAVAVAAAWSLVPASIGRAGSARAGRARWLAYLALGFLAAATIGALLVLLLVACGLIEMGIRTRRRGPAPRGALSFLPLAALPVITGGAAALCWVALKVGALSYGGGFVIIPLMQHDAVVTYHWMSGPQFLDAVALGQITPGPVVQTVAVVGYAASGVWGGLLAAAVAFAPSFAIVLAGGRHLDRLRASERAQAFFVGAGAAVIGAIAGSSIALGRQLAEPWQLGLLALAALWLLALRRGVLSGLLLAGGIGIVAALVGAPLVS